MIRIVILGTGNVAKHLLGAFKKAEDVEVVQVYGRNNSVLESLGSDYQTTTEVSSLKQVDIYILAISDDAISEVSKQLDLKAGLVVHTSGSVPLAALSKKTKRGVFYPLQTFSVDRKVDFAEIPICIESENEADTGILKQLASAISKKVEYMDSDQRKALHLAAVMANNFTNHMYYLSSEFCSQNNVPFSLLHPLIQETAKKIEDLSPYDAQTGPARRNDCGTLKKQKAQLKSKRHKKIYSLLSKSIRKTYGKKL